MIMEINKLLNTNLWMELKRKLQLQEIWTQMTELGKFNKAVKWTGCKTYTDKELRGKI